MFKRGDVVQHADEKWIGVFLEDEQRVFVLEGEPTENPINLTRLTEIGGYEFEAAITIGDRAKALEMYRRATTAIHAATIGLEALSPLEALTRLLELRRMVGQVTR